MLTIAEKSKLRLDISSSSPSDIIQGLGMRNGDIGDVCGKHSDMRNRSGRIGGHLITKMCRMRLEN